MRRQDRVMPKDEAVALLVKGEYGVISLVTQENEPYSVPINYVYENDTSVIYVHCATEGKKLDCIAKNPKAQFTVVGKAEVVRGKFTTLYDSVIADGNASIINDPDEKKHALFLICQKYEPDMKDNLEKSNKIKHIINKNLENFAIIKINVSNVFGKANR